MFTVSTFLLDHLRSRSRKLIWLFECYNWDYLPFPEPSSGNLSFDPRHAVKRWAGQHISFDLDGDTVTYERQVLNVPSINKHMGKKFDDASLGLSNVDRTVAQFVLQSVAFGKTIQGQRLVVRAIPWNAPSGGDATSCFGHSIILYVGRVNKPDSFNRSSGSISATQDLGTTVAQLPSKQFQPTCPLVFKGPDCLGSETLAQKSATYQAAKVCNKSYAQCTEYSNTEFFQGLRIIQIESSFVHKSNESFLKKVLNILPGISRKKTIVSNSIHDGGAYGQVIPLIFGRWLMRLIPLQFQDIGTSINFKMAACRGTIHDFLNIRNESIAFNTPHDITKHKGEYGGVGTQTADTVFPDASFHSKLAYVTGQCDGSDIATEEPAPQIAALIAGQSVRMAFGLNRLGTGAVESIFAGYTAGGTDYSAWSDNPIDIARFIITDSSSLNLPESHIAERATARSSGYTLGAIKDVTNSERAVFPSTETARAGVDYKRYYSTGVMMARNFRNPSTAPAQGTKPDREAKYEFDTDGSLLAGTSTLGLVTFYRKRYTCNVTINEPKKAIDFLYDTLLTGCRGFIRWDQLGRLAIDIERPADHGALRENVSPTATSIKVWDVFPWKPLEFIANEPDPLRGKVLIGSHKLHSEVRSITTANYSADGNVITLDADATGAMGVASISGATLSGGSSTVAASGEIEFSGAPAEGDTITAIIDGVEVAIIAAEENEMGGLPNLAIVEQLAFAINAEPLLNWYIEAGAVTIVSTSKVIITAKLGVLNLSSALEENHFAEIADPTIAPTVAASAGALDAGAYLVAYAYRNANGNTNLSPISAITLTASQQIDVTGISLPAGATSIDWFVSVEANSGTMLLVANNNGTGFSINALPATTADDVPKLNTTGEECLRVMMSFADRAQTYADTARANILDTPPPTWPEGGKQSTINQVKSKFRHAIFDFAEQPIVVDDERHQEETGQTNSAEIDLSATDNRNQAVRLCNGYLAKLRDGDFFFKWGSAGEALLLEIGDVVCISDPSGEWRNFPLRIEDLTYNSKFEVFFDGRKYSTSQFDDAVLQTDVPLPSALINFKSPPPDIEFNTVDFPPDGLAQSTDGTGGITSIRGGAIFGDSVYPQFAYVRLIKRAGVTVNEQVSIIYPDANSEAVFEFIASADGLYIVELEVCNQWGCNTTKPTASIVIGLGTSQGLWITPMVQFSGAGSVEWTGGGSYDIP